MNAAAKETRDAASPSATPIRIGLWRGERDAYGVVDAILDRLPPRYTVHEFHTFRATTEDQARADLDQVDLAWFEWAERRKLHLSEFVGATPFLCRVHPEVAYGRGAKEVRWADVDRWLFPAAGLQQTFTTNHRTLDAATVLPTGVDLDRIPAPADKQPNKNIALFGPVHPEDNVVLLFQIMERLVAADDEYHLHITGAAKDEAVIPYLVRQVKQRGLEDHVHFYGIISAAERARWLDQCSYVLSTRPLDRDWTGVIEAMARGLKPVLHHFPSADETFAPNFLFDTADGAVQQLLADDLDPAAYRAFVDERYDINDIAAQFVQLLDRMASDAYPERVAHFFAAERNQRKATGDASKSAEALLDDLRTGVENKQLDAAADAAAHIDFDALNDDARLEARLLATEVALEQERYTDALFHTDAAMDLAPDEPLVVHLTGQALWLAGEPDAGAEALVRSAELLLRAEEDEATIRFAMEHAEAYLVAGEICEQVGEHEAARRFFEKANQHDPDNDEITAALDRVSTDVSSIEPPLTN